jgi:hypothetical protein
MHQINEIFACVEALRFISDAEAALQDHPARESHASAMAYIAQLVSDRLEVVGQDMDDREWRPAVQQDRIEQTATH